MSLPDHMTSSGLVTERRFQFGHCPALRVDF